MKRRAFLAGAGLTVLFGTGCSLPVFPRRPMPTPDAAAGWIRYRDGRYRLYIPRAEMGQNIATAMRQIACEELGIDANLIDVQLGDTASIDPVRATVGSESIKLFALPLAQACATLREALARGDTGLAEARPIPAHQLRTFSRHKRHVGKAAALADGRAIVTGLPLYAGDIRRPGQLFGRVLRAPVSPELPSTLTHIDEAAARKVPGFVKLVRSDELAGIGIVARTPGALDRIAAALAPVWQMPERPGSARAGRLIDIDRHLARGALQHTVRDDAMQAGAGWTIDLRIDIAAAAHGGIEPRCAVAEYRENGMELWAGTQDPFYIRAAVADKLGVPQNHVLVHPMRIGGAFGARTICTVELEAAVLARAVKGVVKVQWTRAQEFAQAFHRPPSSHRLRASVRNGLVTAWWHAFASSHILFTSAAVPPWLQKVLTIRGDAGVARGSALAYKVPRQRIEYSAVRLPFFTGPWRGLGAGPNMLAVESAIDECARTAGIDPLALRLQNMENGRLKQVLQAVAELAGWQGPRRREEDGVLKGFGLACGIYKESSYAAVVAEVAVRRASGAARVVRMWCVHDCGLVINPDQVRAQVEGNLVWSIGMVLIEALPFEDGAVAAASFADAPIPRCSDMPRMDIRLAASGEPPSGAGETAIVAGAAAIANALCAATGIRTSAFPLRGKLAA